MVERGPQPRNISARAPRAAAAAARDALCQLGRGRVVGRDAAREPEVADLEVAIRVEEQVRRFEVAVQHRRRVHVLERAQHLEEGSARAARARLISAQRRSAAFARGEAAARALALAETARTALAETARTARLVHEVLDVLERERLARVDDAVEVGLHQVGDDVHVEPVGRAQRRRRQDVDDVDHVLVIKLPQQLELTQHALRVGDVVERARDLLDRELRVGARARAGVTPFPADAAPTARDARPALDRAFFPVSVSNAEMTTPYAPVPIGRISRYFCGTCRRARDACGRERGSARDRERLAPPRARAAHLEHGVRDLEGVRLRARGGRPLHLGPANRERRGVCQAETVQVMENLPPEF